MSIVPSIMQVLWFEAKESTHPLEFALVCEAISFEGAEQFLSIEHEYAFGWDRLRHHGGEPIYWRLDRFRFEIAGPCKVKYEVERWSPNGTHSISP